MVQKSLNRNLFRIYDENTDRTYYGCNQEWYATEWQRRAGCGPTTACNMISYMFRNSSMEGQENKAASMEESLAFMEEVWQYVTPSNRGIPTTKMFYDSIANYIKAKDLGVTYKFVDVPEEADRRPDFHQLLEFVGQSLGNDAPVAFLNLCNGEEKNLYRWHWVTIISLEYAEDESSACIDILDEGTIKSIDLALWYRTTTLGGGFVCLT